MPPRPPALTIANNASLASPADDGRQVLTYGRVLGALRRANPRGPVLTITLTATNTAVVSWPYPSTGWNLQQNGDLSATNWVTPSETINNDGTNNFIIVNPPVANKYYRLFKP